MFSNIRTNSQIYILHKGPNPSVEIGTVISVTPPKPKFPVPVQFGQTQEMVVDVVARVGEQNVTYQSLPANLDVADNGSDNVVVTTGRDAMNSEVLAIKQRSLDAISSVDYHKGVVKGCDEILTAINPEYAEKEKQKEEISRLNDVVSVLSQQLSELTSYIKGEGKG